jgi:dTDP-4-dehydrorhamnose 3,5-epimerase-like enzyme
MSDLPELIRGGVSADHRGRVAFVNDFRPEAAKRFYIVESYAVGTVRAWHGHKHERKWAIALAGAALACCVKVDDWEQPSQAAEVHRYTLDATLPAVLAIPAGYANGAMSLLPGTRLMYLSDVTLEDSLDDDYRFPPRHWDPWHVER